MKIRIVCFFVALGAVITSVFLYNRQVDVVDLVVIDNYNLDTKIERQSELVVVADHNQLTLEDVEKNNDNLSIKKIDDSHQNPYLRLPKKPTEKDLINARIHSKALGKDLSISSEFAEFLEIEEYQVEEIENYLRAVRLEVQSYQRQTAVFLEDDEGAITIYIPAPEDYERLSGAMKDNLVRNVSATIGEVKADQFFKLQSKKLLSELGYFNERDYQIDVHPKDRGGDYLVYETFTTEKGTERRIGYGIKGDDLESRFQHFDGFNSRLEDIN
ncbi:hypothetical protein MLD52_06990 [Puniceicoccaceae bacterium K14]|nr:hypothetical protein [Puniceicoccaceae bacterium K14]